MIWKHKTDLDWMKERQRHLTATDIASLVPYTKTGRPRKITDQDYMKVLSRKLFRVTDNECWSEGSAARGHELEPYAIEAYNEVAEEYHSNWPRLYHWDDELIARQGTGRNLAFSPDALDLPQSSDEDVDGVRNIGEIKCYGAERHIATIFCQDKFKLEERWQIATAQVVLPNTTAYLILYNPGMREYKLGIIQYRYDELEAEQKIIRQIESDWLEWLDKLDATKLLGNDRSIWNTSRSEEEICELINEKKGEILNPR